MGGAAVSFPLLRPLFNRCPSNNSEESGWVSLPLQDKRMGPWKRHKVTKKDGAVIMQWLGDLRRCGICRGATPIDMMRNHIDQNLRCRADRTLGPR